MQWAGNESISSVCILVAAAVRRLGRVVEVVLGDREIWKYNRGLFAHRSRDQNSSDSRRVMERWLRARQYEGRRAGDSRRTIHDQCELDSLLVRQMSLGAPTISDKSASFMYRTIDCRPPGPWSIQRSSDIYTYMKLQRICFIWHAATVDWSSGY